MNIEIMSCTDKPIDTISLAAGTCYGKHNVSEKRVWTCLSNGHTSVMEHASITFRVTGISRACSHQLVRHRIASYSQQSQRYCRIDVDSKDWYVVPPRFESVPEYHDAMRDAARNYRDALEHGIKPEDARYMLPEACKTEIVVTANVRELMNMVKLRTDKAAQWEIRYMFERVCREVSAISDQWATIIKMIRGEYVSES